MESQPQNPEFRINPENSHPWTQNTVEYHYNAMFGVHKYNESCYKETVVQRNYRKMTHFMAIFIQLLCKILY